ncbi:MAG: isoprenylcysteine carboxylmethyltransferase family protein [Chromatiaceae bacterium]
MIVRLALWFLLLFGGAAVGLWLDARYFPRLLVSPWFHLLAFAPGVAILWLVVRVSRNTGRWLARHGREGELPRLETNRLVTTGPYACMRHPMHLGLLFFPLAVALLLGSPSFAFMVAPVEMLLIVLLIRLLEEPEARRKFGDPYAAYRRGVPMFSLRPDCLRRLLSDPLAAPRESGRKS